MSTETGIRQQPYEWTDSAILMVRTALGISLSLVNTGGGCMCLIGRLETGHELIIGDAWDSLSCWAEDMNGWGVSVYGPDREDVGQCCPTADATSAGCDEDEYPSPLSLVHVIRRALRRLSDPACHSPRGTCCASVA